MANKERTTAVNTVKKVRGKPFLAGQDTRRNKTGRPRGVLNYETKMKLALEKIAAERGVSAEDLEIQLFMLGFKMAENGDYPFFKDYMDRIHGKPTQTVEANVKSELKLGALREIQEATKKILGL